MKVLFIGDKNLKTEYSIDLDKKLNELFTKKGYESKTIKIGEKDLASCAGCFGCWIKTPGECIINDLMSEINRSYMNSDIVIYLTPIIFGQFSANIKNAMDRRIPNILPFFEKVNGVTKHPSRYEKYPNEMIIGYSDDITKEEKNTFLDLIKKHRKKVENIFFCLSQESNKEIIEDIKKII
ncbi:NAD(P)H-dependent oxidoreductase [Clostridium pasteurianum]|uniref:NADPH-dependent FMN reductase n=1 Tax=Clostridium pasteurianum BC1 TaxID=86416 RepID=R4JWW7_CLOPA|nr:flavodoxin family protein [Clostridium pasteurianum]AGK95312.1 NADPH-dependent FMN reductase [Clostridium pasteurianum BC1]